ncbi:MAG: O-antigen ligase family protein [Flavobacteriales bacterium]|jgi:hypothetical protein|nr:O-antigen ligase family protein [Flavobacteriales bacterium]
MGFKQSQILTLFKLYQKNFFHYNYTFFCIALVVGLSTSEIIMSVASISLAINWLLEGQFKKKYALVKQRKQLPSLLIIGYFSLTIWLINTSNFEYAFNDLKVKLPLLVFPLVLGSITLSFQQIQAIFKFFVLGLLFSTLISFLVYLEIIPIKKDLSDIRNISIFISHIRLSLLICLAIVLLIKPTKGNYIFPPILTIGFSLWFILFLFILQAFTGLFILGVLSIVFLAYLIFKSKNKLLKLFVTISFIGIGAFFTHKVYTIYNNNFVAPPIIVSQLDYASKTGEVYQYKVEDDWLENGNRVWLYIAPKELAKAWNARSTIPFDSTDHKGQPMWGTLYRYLTSKNLRKDQEGLEKLSHDEIRAIEQGTTNCCEKLNGFDKKIKDVIFEFERYRNGQNPNGHSFIQRIIYLRASVELFKHNFWFGVGLGDVHDEFLTYYEENNSLLKGKNRKRVHNQYMSFAVGLGVFGLIIWLFILYFPIVKKPRNKNIYLLFILIISLSFLTDNTLERQAGVMFFAFFNSLFLFQPFKSQA